jgi:hypothetical protein
MIMLAIWRGEKVGMVSSLSIVSIVDVVNAVSIVNDVIIVSTESLPYLQRPL